MKRKKKTKAYAVVTEDGCICVNLIRDNILACVDAHEALTGVPWYYYKERGYSVQRVYIAK